MTMTVDQARAIERAVIEVGHSYEFYCEMQQEYEPPERRLRRFTGQTVTVLRNLRRDEYDGPGDRDEDFETSRVFAVCAQDGTEFQAHVEELDGWDRDLGQFFWPDGTYGPDHDQRFLAAERRQARS